MRDPGLPFLGVWKKAQAWLEHSGLRTESPEIQEPTSSIAQTHTPYSTTSHPPKP
jgi:hypothetical protein